MAVSGFGANGGEIKDQKVIPDRLLVYRRFRFRPHTIGGKADYCWAQFLGDSKRDSYTPCLSPASYVDTYYTREGSYLAICHKDSMRPVKLFQAMMRMQGGEEEKLGGHAAPDKDCQCGFWAYYTPDDVDTGNGDEWSTLAAVKVWGDVVLGDKGVRAQFMQIVGLQIPPELMEADVQIVDAWTAMVARLKVPSFWAKSEMLKFFPPQDVSALLPKPEPAPPYPFDDVMLMRMPTTWRQNIPPHQLWAVNAPAPRTYYTTSTTGSLSQTFGGVTYYENKCCVCGYNLIAQSQAGLDDALYTHIMTTHP